MRERLGMSQEQVEEYMREMWDWYCGRLNVPLADYLRRLRPHYQTAILSNSFVGARREEQQRHQVEDMCDLIIYSHEVGVAKPDRRIFELTWQRLGVQPEEMLFLDNAQVHVEAAQACGIQAILFEDTTQALAALESRLQASLRSCCANEHSSACSRHLQPEKGCKILWHAQQRDRDLGSA
jgi:putative hydrolase of the HAD superfamily